jgi:glycosyltransferase involved in cell wall biosynthesis
MLSEHLQFLEAEIKKSSKKEDLVKSVEIIIVDDGSKDKTWEIIKEWTKKYAPENFEKTQIVIRGL